MHNIISNLIQKFPPELSHSLTIKLLKLDFLSKIQEDDPSLAQHIFGLDFKNPVGLAAGFDKNVEVVNSLLKLGFGFVEAGTVTPKPQFGNEKPRLFRLKEDQALINHLGFNNYGIEYAKSKLIKLNLNNLSTGIVGINLGANKDTKYIIDDYTLGLEKLGPLAHYTVINVSSPNTPGLRKMQHRGKIELLIKSLVKIKDKINNLESKPILLKIDPDMDEEKLRDIALICLANNIDGIIIGNSTIDRPNILRSKNSNEIGGLSGKPLFTKSTLILKKMYILTNGQIPLIGVGGISNGIQFYEKIKSGASLAQIYTSLIYQGPKIIQKIKKEILSCLKTDGIRNIKDAVGKDV